MTVRLLLHVQRLCMHAIRFNSFTLSFPSFKHETVTKNLWRIHRLDAGAESCCTSLVSTLSLPSNEPLLSVFSISVKGDSGKKRRGRKNSRRFCAVRAVWIYVVWKCTLVQGNDLEPSGGWGGGRVVVKKNLSSASQSVAVESHDCCSYKARKQLSRAKFWVYLPLKNE